MRSPQFWTYILTNYNKTVLYTGVTNNLARRLVEHWVGTEKAFTTRYNVHYLLYAEETRYILNAIAREKEIKLLSRSRKEAVINEHNAEWRFWNEAVLGNWPPTDNQMLEVKDFWRGQLRLGQTDSLFFLNQVNHESS